MTEEKTAKLIIIMDKNLTQRTVLINPKIKPHPFHFGGYEFQETDKIDGIVMLGGNFPLRNHDVSLESIFKIADAIDKVPHTKTVFQSAPGSSILTIIDETDYSTSYLEYNGTQSS